MTRTLALEPLFVFANGTSTSPSKDDLSKLDTAVLQFRFARAVSSPSASTDAHQS